jgi:hypothetical protein
LAIETILQTTGALISVVGEMQSALGERGSHIRVHDRLVTALRQIYFTPSRTLGILAMLAEGERPPEEIVRPLLLDFNDAEWRVMDALHSLENFEDERAVSLRTARVIREIAYGKRNLRAYIQDLLNEALTFDSEINTQEVRAALACVKSLNSAIESVEAAYNWRTGAI